MYSAVTHGDGLIGPYQQHANTALGTVLRLYQACMAFGRSVRQDLFRK